MNKNTPKIGDETCAQIAALLPQALGRAINSYHQFPERPTNEEAQDFKNHHIACKAALAHIELLMKLANITDLENGNSGDELQKMLNDARDELDKGHE